MTTQSSARRQCVLCESHNATESLAGLEYCGSCVLEAAIMPHASTAWLVELIERLADLGVRVTEPASLSLAREFEPAVQAAEAVQQVTQQLRVNPEALLAAHGRDHPYDTVLSYRLYDFVCDNGGYWLAGADVSMAAWLLQEHPDASVLELLTDPAAQGQFEEFLETTLACQIPFEELTREAWADKLAQIWAAALALGASRIHELGMALLSGEALPAKFSESERRLYLDLFERPRRCAERAWFAIHELAEDIHHMNARAEQLLQAWILLPVGDPLCRYFRMLYRCYVAGFMQETVILCRSILEHSIKKALDALGGDWPGDLNERIQRLSRLGILTRSLSESAQAVRIRGNKVIHDDPDTVKDTWGTIRATIDVAQHLAEVARHRR